MGILYKKLINPFLSKKQIRTLTNFKYNFYFKKSYSQFGEDLVIYNFFQKEKINGTTSITNIIDFAPVFTKLLEGLEEERPEYNQPRRRSLRDHSGTTSESQEPDYDMDYYGDYSTSSIVKQLTKESIAVQRKVSYQNKQFCENPFLACENDCAAKPLAS